MTLYGKSQFNVLQSILTACVLFSALQLNAQTIVHPSDASIAEQQAAKEIRRYIFLRTGTAPALAIADNYSSLPAGDVIVVSTNARAIITELKHEYGNVDAPDSDNRMGYIIKSISKDGRNVLVITGADTPTTLTAAYRFAELIGCHFNLAGDVIPDAKLPYPLTISGYDEKSQPWFELRGCIPFHNFTAGPDLWNTVDYVSFITQQAKMGLNFFGLHYYNKSGFPGSQEGPEPQLWIGHKDDVNADGTINPESAYKSYWASSFRKGEMIWDGEERPIWGASPVSVSKFTNGTDKLFAHDYCASEAIGSKEPTTPAEMAANFNNVGVLLNRAFTHAKQLGVKTALGTETPMGVTDTLGSGRNARSLLDEEEGEEEEPMHPIFTCPPEVQARMRDVHGYTLPTARGSVNETFAKALYEGMFTKIMRTHPLDYFWLWTMECWTYNGPPPARERIEAVADDNRYCSEVMKAMKAPFKMATFGWTVGSAGAGYGNGSLEFHDDLPIDVPFGTLSDNAAGIEDVIDAGRNGWSSCWYEEDWGLVQPQLRVMGMFNDVGCGLKAGGSQAFLAKHWRINSVAQASTAHAQLTWDNRVSVSDPMPSITDGVNKYPAFDIFDTPLADHDPKFVHWITKFYQGWAKANFGPERSHEIGALLAMADRHCESNRIRDGVKGGIPKVAQFLPSSIVELWPDDGDPLSPTDPRFIDAMHVYTEFCKYKDDIVGTGNRDRYMYWYHFFKGQIEMAKLAMHRYAYEDPDKRTPATKDKIIETWSKVMNHEIQRLRNESELGVIAQLQQSTWDGVFRKQLGITEISTSYEGEAAVRGMPEISQIYENEDFEQKVIFIGNGAIIGPTLYYREIGSTGSFLTAALTPIGNSVMKAKLPNPGYDFEYYIQGAVGGETVTYPVTGGNGTGKINKTVITVKKVDFGELKPAERVEMTPERVAAMNRYLKKFYMDWLDRPIAGLDDRRPRECCETRSGKAKVAALIRDMGSPTTYGVEVPKQAMLRELGLQ